MKALGRWGRGAALLAAAIVLVFIQAQDPDFRQWKERVTLPSCGSVVIAHNESLRRDASSKVACLQNGLENKRGAGLQVQRPTIEGDPIQYHYRVTPSGTTELYVDYTKDTWGDNGWSFEECRSPSSALDTEC